MLCVVEKAHEGGEGGPSADMPTNEVWWWRRLHRHDFHHSHWNNGNYGGAFFHFWDWACGTDQDYLKWKRAQRGEAKKAE